MNSSPLRLLEIVNGPSDSLFFETLRLTERGDTLYFVVRPYQTRLNTFHFTVSLTGADIMPGGIDQLWSARLVADGVKFGATYNFDTSRGVVSVARSAASQLPVRLLGFTKPVRDKLAGLEIKTLGDLLGLTEIHLCRQLGSLGVPYLTHESAVAAAEIVVNLRTRLSQLDYVFPGGVGSSEQIAAEAMALVHIYM